MLQKWEGQLLSRAATLPGSALGLVFSAAAHLRPADKPLHPRGSLLPGSVERSGLTGDPVGVAWIDEPGHDDVTVRVSRSLGLPERLPDIHGLAVRIPLGASDTDGHADLLFSTTGRGRLTRFLLAPSVDRAGHAYTTLMPYRTAAGPLLLAALPAGRSGLALDLACASPQGGWRRFGHLSIDVPPGSFDEVDHGTAAGTVDARRLESIGPDPTVSFDPILNQLPGLTPYPWVASLREGAYAAARRARGSREDTA
jgi:hypothetical protein